VYRGSRARVEIRQGQADAYRPELYVVPVDAASKSVVLTAVTARIASLHAQYPGVAVEDRGGDIHIAIPDAFRVGHEAHFAQVTANFLKYLQDRTSMPTWERPNMLAKYYVTTTGAEMSRKGPSRPAPRIAK
jgi:hypothetical protein